MNPQPAAVPERRRNDDQESTRPSTPDGAGARSPTPTQPPNPRRVRAKRPPRCGSLKGKWFHSWVNGAIHWQGHILSEQPGGLYLVQLFSWLDSGPTDQRLVPFSQMKDWTFYATAFEMRHRYSRYVGDSEADFEQSEKVLRLFG